MDAVVRVWALPDVDTQHDAIPPADDTAKEWEGSTACGIVGMLRWVHGETVDRAKTCAACVGAVGTAPPLEGDDLGPV
ncbi:MAG: hypothetical protein GEU74_11665 [Nitriliruptorales bacterium]|nr:hypothetical protein [Nitriliruptorales bacterium]